MSQKISNFVQKCDNNCQNVSFTSNSSISKMRVCVSLLTQDFLTPAERNMTFAWFFRDCCVTFPPKLSQKLSQGVPWGRSRRDVCQVENQYFQTVCFTGLITQAHRSSCLHPTGPSWCEVGMHRIASYQSNSCWKSSMISLSENVRRARTKRMRMSLTTTCTNQFSRVRAGAKWGCTESLVIKAIPAGKVVWFLSENVRRARTKRMRMSLTTTCTNQFSRVRAGAKWGCTESLVIKAIPAGKVVWFLSENVRRARTKRMRMSLTTTCTNQFSRVRAGVKWGCTESLVIKAIPAGKVVWFLSRKMSAERGRSGWGWVSQQHARTNSAGSELVWSGDAPNR